jgi:NAD-dependent deacetylase sirtuin 5
LLVLGTSSTVYPAAGFATQVQAQGGKAAVFNVEEAGENADWFFEGGVEQTLAKALDMETLTSSQL